jgi:hypothetical protein
MPEYQDRKYEAVLKRLDEVPDEDRELIEKFNRRLGSQSISKDLNSIPKLHNGNQMEKKMSNEETRIRASKKLTKKLKDIGKKGESYEDVIWRLIKSFEEEEKS